MVEANELCRVLARAGNATREVSWVWVQVRISTVVMEVSAQRSVAYENDRRCSRRSFEATGQKSSGENEKDWSA